MSNENLPNEAHNPPLRKGDVSGCPYVTAQIVIIEELNRIANLPAAKTFKGAFRRAGKARGLILQLRELELMKKGFKPIPPFEKGGVVNGLNADKIFVDGNEYIIPAEPSDDPL